jgi:protoporphyrinogen IX oxidase
MYEWIQALHVIAVIAWMAAMLYLPRLFVYHAVEPKGTPTSETFKIMERRLLKAIMTPAMIAVWLFGLVMMVQNGLDWLAASPWMHAKLVLVLAMSGIHGWFAGMVRVFAEDRNTRPQRFYRIINEVPTVLMVLVVILVIVKPF